MSGLHKHRWVLLGIVLLLMLRLVYHVWPTPRLIMSYVVSEDFPATGVSETFKHQVAHLDVMAYAFLSVSEAGLLDVPMRELASFKDFVGLKLPSPLKKLISLGGAEDTASFFHAILHRDAFVSSVKSLMTTYHLSGIDLDFESNLSYQPQEATQYTALIMQLRQVLGPQAFITMTTMVDPDRIRSLGEENWKLIGRQIDALSVMCYDLSSPFSPPYLTAFASNLYRVPDAPRSSQNFNMSCDDAVQTLIAFGVPPRKILLGVPAYAVAFGGVAAVNNGLFQPAVPKKSPELDNIGRGRLRYSRIVALNQQDFQAHVTKAGAWSYSPTKRQFITYETPQVLAEKVDYVAEHHLGGIMIWRIGQDVEVEDGRSLLRAIVR